MVWSNTKTIVMVMTRSSSKCVRSLNPVRVRHVKFFSLVVTLWCILYYRIRATDSNDIFEILIFGHFDHFWPLGRSKVVIFKKLSNIIDRGLIRSQIGRRIWICLKILDFRSFWPLLTTLYGQKWSFFKFYQKYIKWGSFVAKMFTESRHAFGNSFFGQVHQLRPLTV